MGEGYYKMINLHSNMYTQLGSVIECNKKFSSLEDRQDRHLFPKQTFISRPYMSTHTTTHTGWADERYPKCEN